MCYLSIFVLFYFFIVIFAMQRLVDCLSVYHCTSCANFPKQIHSYQISDSLIDFPNFQYAAVTGGISMENYKYLLCSTD